MERACVLCKYYVIDKIAIYCGNRKSNNYEKYKPYLACNDFERRKKD